MDCGLDGLLVAFLMRLDCGCIRGLVVNSVAVCLLLICGLLFNDVAVYSM